MKTGPTCKSFHFQCMSQPHLPWLKEDLCLDGGIGKKVDALAPNLEMEFQHVMKQQRSAQVLVSCNSILLSHNTHHISQIAHHTDVTPTSHLVVIRQNHSTEYTARRIIVIPYKHLDAA